VPSQIGKYEVLRRLGRGGMGTVFLGSDPDLGRLVAIKILHEHLYEEELLQRFLQEARAAASLRHDNIVTVYDVGQHDRQPYMAMEYVDGTSLGDMIRDRQTLTLADELACLEQLCAGLHYAHLKKIVHRDIKPANLMIDRAGVLRILDFGIARVEGSAMTTDGSMIGTLNYMSPEQMLGQAVDYRSDIFAVGAVAYELLSSQKAFGGSTHDGLLQRLAHDDPPSLIEIAPGVPPAVVAVVMRALAKRPDDRFSSLDEMRQALSNVRCRLDSQYELTVIAPPRSVSLSATPPPSSRSRHRPAPPVRSGFSRTKAAVAMALVVVAVAAPAGLWWRNATSNTATTVTIDGTPGNTPTRPTFVDATSPPEAVTPAAIPSATVVDPSLSSSASRPRADAGLSGPSAGREEEGKSARSAPAATSPATIPSAPTTTGSPLPPPGIVTPSAPPSAPTENVTAMPLPGPVASVPSPVPDPAPAAAPPAPSRVAVEGPRILRLLTRYQDAYRKMDVNAIGNVYVTFPRESRQQLERNFKACQAFDATFGTPDSFIGEDPTLATVNVRITYVCTPKTRQAPIVSSADEVFRLRKLGGDWLIERAGNMNAGS
jgi:eukaryotic-like serine/threonine-protein kinase